MARSVRGFIGEDEGWVDWFMGSWRDLVSGRGGSIDLWVRGFMARSHRRVEGTRTAIGSWCDLTSGRGGSISSWVRGTISPSRGGDEDGDLTSAISNSTAQSLSFSLCLRVCESFLSLSLSLFLSLRVSENDLKVKQKLKIFYGLKGLFYGQSK